MTNKNKQIIKNVLPALTVNMGGILLLQPFPTQNVEHIDPFLLLHHHHGVVEKGRKQSDAGIGPHPHRGFSPVTFVFKGDVHHRDSRGNSSVVKAGGVQWMNAGMGIIHSERPSKELLETGGEQEILQLWINTPAANKMNEPRYFALQREEMPQVDIVEGDVRIVAGTFAGKMGQVKTYFPLVCLMGHLNPDDELPLIKPEGENAFLYVLDGDGFLHSYGVLEEKTLYTFHQQKVETALKAKSKLRFIYVSALPINEKVQQYGPYVMNSQTEILEALRDYQMGKMGFLVEEF